MLAKPEPLVIDRSYRLYQLGADGKIRSALNREFDDDMDAMRHARELLASHPGVEVWQTNRLVGLVEQSPAALCA